MSEPQVLSMEQVDEKEARLKQEIKRHEDYAKLVEPPEYQKLHAGEYVDWVIHVKRSTMENLIATVREKDAALSELAGIYDLQYGAFNQQLRDQLNEAVAVMQEIHKYADHTGVHKRTSRRTLLDTIMDMSGRFLAKHQDSPTRANDQTTSG